MTREPDIVERLRQGAGHEPADIIAAEKTMEEAADEIERLRNLVLGACDIFCQLDAPHWAAEFRRALEPKP